MSDQNTKKKIVIIGSAYPFRGGLASYNERLARAFQDTDNEVTIYTFTVQYPSVFFPGKTQYSDAPAPEDLTIHRVVHSVNPLNWIMTGKKIRKLKPDIVIIKFWIPFMAPCLGTIAGIIKRNKSIKVISIIDNIIPHESRIGDKWLARYFIKRIDGFIVMSDSVLHDLEHFNKTKPKHFCPHPLFDNFGDSIPKPQARKTLGLNPEQPHVLFFGFIRPYKGLDLLLEAMANEKVRKLGIKLIVAGEFYTDSRPYLDLIADLGLNESVIMKNDFIPDQEVAKYFCAADIVVQPYKDATQSGITQIAYHFNKPMLVTDVGGLSEIIPHGKVGYVVKPEPGEIAESLVNFYEAGKEKEFSIHAEYEKRKYSWERMINEIIDLYKILNKKR